MTGAARLRAQINANPAPVLFGVGLLGAIGVILAVGAQTTFLRGDWDFLIYRRGSLEQTLLEPSAGNVVVGQAIIYRALVHVFGLDPLAFRVTLAILFATSSILLFVTLRRRVGDGAAAVGAGLTLLMGAAFQDLIWPLQLGYVVAVAAGLGALLALKRRDRRGDVCACLLLSIGALTFTAGLAFVVAAAVAVALAPGARRRSWVPAVPAFLALIWLAAWGRHANAGPIGSEVLDSPVFLFNWLASSLAALLGLSTPQNASSIGGIEWGRALLIVGLGAAALRIHRLGRVPRGVWPPVAGALAFGLVAGAYEEPGRLATSSRYTYVGAVFVLMIAAELAAGSRLRRPAVAALLVIGAAAIASSANYLGSAADRLGYQAKLERAGLTAIELARDTVAPGFTLERPALATNRAPVSAGAYLAAVDRYGGSAAYSESELLGAPAYARAAADRTLAAVLRIRLESRGATQGGCGEITNSGEREATVAVGRFSGRAPAKVGRIPPGGSAVLVIPADGSTRPWHAQLDGAPISLDCR